jgi:hypothetical protein
MRNPIEPRRIPTELPRLSYKGSSRQVGRSSGSQSLATLPTRLHLSTTLRMRALQVEFPKWLCVFLFPPEAGGGIYRAVMELHRLGRGDNSPLLAGLATWPAGRLERLPPTFSSALAFLFSCRCVSMKLRNQVVNSLV